MVQKTEESRIGDVGIFINGYRLHETGEFIKLNNGKIIHKRIKQYNGYTIKFDTNGYGLFSIWKEDTCLEDRFDSIHKAEECIGKWETSQDEKR